MILGHVIKLWSKSGKNPRHVSLETIVLSPQRKEYFDILIYQEFVLAALCTAKLSSFSQIRKWRTLIDGLLLGWAIWPAMS